MKTQILDAICSSVPSEGAPGGILYAALMQAGVDFGTFESLMAALVSSGKLYKKGEMYFPVPSFDRASLAGGNSR